MPKKRKGRRTAEPEEPEIVLPKAPAVGTRLGALLEQAGLQRVDPARKTPAKKAPVRAHSEPSPKTMMPPGPARLSLVPEPEPHDAPLSSRELAVLHQAYVGVEPMGKPGRTRVKPALGMRGAAAKAEDPSESAARARLGALVGEGVQFEVRRDDGFVQGLQHGAAEKLLRPLQSSRFAPQARLDLHGMRRDPALRAVHDFVRAQHRAGARQLLIIAGKGQHSEGGVLVLGEALIEALTRGGAAPLVRAFASAHNSLGGSGAVAVLLA